MKTVVSDNEIIQMTATWATACAFRMLSEAVLSGEIVDEVGLADIEAIALAEAAVVSRGSTFVASTDHEAAIAKGVEIAKGLFKGFHMSRYAGGRRRAN